MMVYRSIPDLIIFYCRSDLLAVRRIPLQRHPYISEDLIDSSSPSQSAEPNERRKPDPGVKSLRREMQNIVAGDRDLHEKVRPMSFFFIRGF